jgi:colanic acid/amylovoran biosynthesis glycosyltransferase
VSEPTEPLRVAYVMTHHPRVATTFISGEIDGITRSGGEIVPVAINLPGPDDLTTAEARRTAEETLHLKGVGYRRLVGALARFAVRDPAGAARTLGTAVRSAGLDLGTLARRLVHLADAAYLVEHLRERDVTHLHAHFGQAPATIAWFTTLVGNCAVGETWTWSFTIHGFQDFVHQADARLDLKSGSARFVACISDFTRSQLCGITDPRHWDRFHVLRCGIDLERFADRGRRPISTPPHLITVARLSPEKGQVVLIDALARLHATGIDATLEIVGSGPYESELRTAVARHGLDDHVTFAGELLPALVSERLRSADVFCLPSFSEGLPVSIMEAMAIGTPVVATAISGIPELAIHDETALTVPPGNADALAHALRRMCTEPGLAEELSGAARAAVAERHDVRRTVEAMRGHLADASRRPLPR